MGGGEHREGTEQDGVGVGEHREGRSRKGWGWGSTGRRGAGRGWGDAAARIALGRVKCPSLGAGVHPGPGPLPAAGWRHVLPPPEKTPALMYKGNYTATALEQKSNCKRNFKSQI